MPIKLTTEQFIEKAQKVHDNKYDYSLVDYKGSKSKIVIICKEHGAFEQIANTHLNGSGCLKCGILSIRLSRVKSLEKFISDAKVVHGNKYSYTEYINDNTKISIFCKKCNLKFFQTPNIHLSGSGCTKCSIDIIKSCRTLSSENFIIKSKLKHGDLYNYSKVDYINSHKEVIIICSIHGEFKQRANDHLQGKGCPVCRLSIGEIRIRNILKENNIKFIEQKRFIKCKNKRALPFDFYLPDHNLCIEYDGEGHYKNIPRSKDNDKNIKNFENTKINDNIKDKFCKDNKINLLRIPYTEIDNISCVVSRYTCLLSVEPTSLN